MPARAAEGQVLCGDTFGEVKRREPSALRCPAKSPRPHRRRHPSRGKKTARKVPLAQRLPSRDKAEKEVSVKHRGSPGNVCDVGQLGLGPDVMELARPTLVADLKDVVDVMAGGMHTLCLTADVKVKLVQMMLHYNKRLRETRSSSRIASGSDHVVMLMVKGYVLTMGCGEQGQLGRVPMGTTLHRACCTSLHLLKPTNVYIPKPRGSKTRAFDRIWARAYTTYALLCETGKLYAFGLNNHHQMGVQAHRSNDIGQIISVPRALTSCQGHRWQLLSRGQHHTLLLSEEGLVFTLGRKDYGWLELGAFMPAGNEDQETPAQVPGLSGCVEVSCGEAVSFAIDGEGRLHSWEFGTNGQLGHGGDDLFEPKVVAGKLAGKKALVVSEGGQHAVILAT
ncbi:regulator of chromosome condensation-like [Dermacentor silvarum]|uniref:regulator of chromosome condensation-like n=1 Tax=Dermacentor silvarum TaxID=543639 RepID=UPI0021017959|nr:regulator of chromosome condensation-like [Dermacentor silvarum]